MLPADTPKLAKWPFLVGDAVLLGLAWLIASQTRAPLAGLPLGGVLICVIGGAILAVIPFLSDYARKQDEALDERQRNLESLSRTMTSAAEQIGIATNGLHEIASVAQQNLKAAEQLVSALQAHPAQPQSITVDLEKLQEAAEKAAKAATEITRIESTAQKHFSAAVDTLAKTTAAIETLNSKAALRSLESSTPFRAPPAISLEPFKHPDLAETPTEAKPVDLEVSPPVSDAVAAVAEPPATSAAIAETPVDAPATVVAEPPVEKPKRVRKPRERKPSAPAEPAAELARAAEAATAVIDEPAPADAPSTSEVVERVRTSDGATRLIVTAYIGIGNRLFIRGEGPGLSWENGVPLQFVSIGRWRWETAEAAAPIKFKLYKNDTAECTSLGEQSIDPGQQEEITALF